MNALTGNKAALRIFRSMDMNALTGKAQNHPARSIEFIDSGQNPDGFRLESLIPERIRTDSN
jgi:hypothetical protein